jgi:hypothetical protein
MIAGMSEPVPLPPDDYPGPTPDPEMVAIADQMRADAEAARAELPLTTPPAEGAGQ